MCYINIKGDDGMTVYSCYIYSIWFQLQAAESRTGHSQIKLKPLITGKSLWKRMEKALHGVEMNPLPGGSGNSVWRRETSHHPRMTSTHSEFQAFVRFLPVLVCTPCPRPLLVYLFLNVVIFSPPSRFLSQKVGKRANMFVLILCLQTC